jgi:hypothetical protein
VKCVLLVLLAVGATSFAAPITIKTLDGRSYANAEVVRIEADGITVFSDTGFERIAFINLPARLQRQYGYDPAKAATFDEGRQTERMEAPSRPVAQTTARQAAADFQRNPLG